MLTSSQTRADLIDIHILPLCLVVIQQDGDTSLMFEILKLRFYIFISYQATPGHFLKVNQSEWDPGYWRATQC